jgi:cysteine desulfurase
MKTKRLYLDYNSTAPLAKKVKESILSDDYPFSNPSSQHSSGKRSNKLVNEAKEFIYNFFGIDESKYNLLFHSGATEGINTVLNTSTFNYLFHFKSDHPCVLAVGEIQKDNSSILSILEDGRFDIPDIINKVNETNTTKNKWLNYTYINNETGVVWPLELALKIKNDTNCFIHVDAVQMIGKTRNVTLLNGLDAYTFSGHKFGALKGIGFSFIIKDAQVLPLIIGGGQQNNLRSGTVNLNGILSLVDALKSYQASEGELDKLHLFKNDIVSLFNNHKNISVVENDSINTICFVHDSMRSDNMLIHFDLEGLDVSTGSACSSGSHEPSRVLMAMGYSDKSNHNIRISLGVENLIDKEEILFKLNKIISKFK